MQKRFWYDNEGRITFAGEPYLYSSSGTTAVGLQRAREKAIWLNECLDKAIGAAQQIVESDANPAACPACGTLDVESAHDATCPLFGTN